MRNPHKRLVFVLLFTLLSAISARAQDYFINSDDYKEGEEIVNVFLKDDDYRLMVEDIERNGEEFDWGWVKTPTASAEAAPQPEAKGKGLRGRFRRGSGGPNPAHPKEFGFQLSAYKTVSVKKVSNHSGLIPQSLPEEIRESFAQAMEQMGLSVVKEGKKADLELELAIVDLKRDSTYVYFANIQPFIELELRLRDVAKGENLILLRNQAHGNTVEDAAMNYASNLLKFLR